VRVILSLEPCTLNPSTLILETQTGQTVLGWPKAKEAGSTGAQTVTMGGSVSGGTGAGGRAAGGGSRVSSTSAGSDDAAESAELHAGEIASRSFYELETRVDELVASTQVVSLPSMVCLPPHAAPSKIRLDLLINAIPSWFLPTLYMVRNSSQGTTSRAHENGP